MPLHQDVALKVMTHIILMAGSSSNSFLTPPTMPSIVPFTKQAFDQQSLAVSFVTAPSRCNITIDSDKFPSKSIVLAYVRSAFGTTSNTCSKSSSISINPSGWMSTFKTKVTVGK